MLDYAKARAELEYTEAAFGELRARWLDELLTSEVAEAEHRERCYLAIRVLDTVRTAVLGVVETGQIEEHVAQLRHPKNE